MATDSSGMPSLAEVYGHTEPATVEIDADKVHRAWAVLDLVCEGDTFDTYGADYKARDALALALVEAGELSEDRLRESATDD